jgi:hypothetical protein
MANDLRPYRAELQAASVRLNAALADGKVPLDTVAFARGVRDLMDEQLLRWPDAVLREFDGKADRQTGYRSAQYWRVVIERNIERQVWPLRDEELRTAHNRKRREYEAVAQHLLALPYGGPTRVEDSVDGVVYLVRPNRALMQQLMPIVAHELMRWFRQHEITKEFLARPADRGFFEFLQTRTDVRAMLRIVDEQPLDVTAYEDPSIITRKTQTTSQMLVELAISLIPVVGDIVAAWEVYNGHDLFGTPLDSLDRGILGACVMLPMLGMVLKDGRVAYREARLVLLHGGEAREWTRAMEAVSRLDAVEIRLLAEAEEALRLAKTLEPALQRRIAGVLPGMVQPVKVLQPGAHPVVIEAMAMLRKADPVFATVDDAAMLRVLEKGPDPNHIKGQLLEELVETRLLPWLATPYARRALGLSHVSRPEGKLMFIPGHMISDESGRQVTDGIIAVWEQGELHILIIFEAKSGKRAARELWISKGGISSLTNAQRAELRAEAERAFQRLKRRAELQGALFNRKVEDIEEEILDEINFAEEGGQIRRDVERLAEDFRNRPAKIFVGDLPEPIPVRISPTGTKFVGLVPSDVDQISIREAVQKLGYSFEIIGVQLSSRKLKDLGNALSPFATNLKAPPP